MVPRTAHAGAGFVVLAGAVLLAPASDRVQSAVADEPASSVPDRARTQPGLDPDPEAELPFEVDYDAERPYDFYERDWRYRMRHFRGSRFSRDRYRGWYRYPGGRYYGPRGGFYGPGFYPGPYYGGFGGYPQSVFDEGYWQGQRDGRRIAEWEARAERGRASYLNAMRTGYAAFRNGDYSLAAKQFILAAKLNQGDPASRLHAAHSVVALGRYTEGALFVRRAIQLQPQLLYLSLDIRRDYNRKADFDTHYAKLKAAAEEAADDADLWFLLGYYQFFSGRPAEAYKSLIKADKLDPGGRTTGRLLEAARLATPAGAAPQENTPSTKTTDGHGG